MTSQLLTCTVVVVFFAALTAATVLPVCPPGSHRSPGSGDEQESSLTCQPCPSGSYMEESNRYTTCKPHRKCGKDEIVMVPGTNTSDVVCRCRSGGRRYHNVEDKAYGYDCGSCTDGNVAKNVTMGMDSGDTACCPPDSQALRTPDGHVQCPGPGESRETSPPPPCSSADEDSCQWKTYFIAVVTPLAMALALAVTAIVFLIFNLRRQCTRMMSSNDVEKLPLDLNT